MDYIGMRKPLKLRLKSPTYSDTLRRLGDDWKVEDDLLDGYEKFFCAMYGKAKFNSAPSHASVQI